MNTPPTENLPAHVRTALEPSARGAQLRRRAIAVAGFGLLVGSLALAGLRTGELPRSLALVGLASAAAGSLSPLYFVWETAAWFIPAGRFSGLLVGGIAGVRLGRRSGEHALSNRRDPDSGPGVVRTEEGT